MGQSPEMEVLLHRVCELTGVAVFCIATVMKVPQILKILQAGSTRGISMGSLAMEFWCFSNLLAYPIANGYAFTSYMEFIALNIQDLILVIMVLQDRGKLNLITTSLLISYISILIGTATSYLPSWVLYAMSSSVTPLSFSGKSLQLYSIMKNKDAGAISPLTWGLGTFTATARILTGIVQSGDKFLIFLSTQAAVLNGAICLSVLWYKPKAKTD